MTVLNRAAEAQGIKRALSQYSSGSVLVVGARAHHFPPPLREHDRIIIWDSTDPDTDSGKPVPASVRVIICLRFIGHRLFAKLQRHAKKAHLLLMPGLNNIGEVKDMLAQALDLAPEPPAPLPEIPDPATIATAEALLYDVRTHGMTTREFVRVYGDRSHLPRSAEARRLFELAPQYGLKHVTVSAIVQQLGIWHRETPPPTQAAPPDRPAPAPPPTTAPPANDTESRLTVALRLIDDAVAGLQLVREAVQRVGDDEMQAQEVVTALRLLLNKTPQRRA